MIRLLNLVGVLTRLTAQRQQVLVAVNTAQDMALGATVLLAVLAIQQEVITHRGVMAELVDLVGEEAGLAARAVPGLPITSVTETGWVIMVLLAEWAVTVMLLGGLVARVVLAVLVVGHRRIDPMGVGLEVAVDGVGWNFLRIRKRIQVSMLEQGPTAAMVVLGHQGRAAMEATAETVEAVAGQVSEAMVLLEGKEALVVMVKVSPMVIPPV